jgi:MYXO-CTERM domain-containing protein
MKKAIVISALAVLASLSVYGQGAVNFRTTTTPTDNRVRNQDGTTFTAGTAGYRAELLYAPDGTADAEFNTLAIRLGADTGVGTPTPGSIQGGGRTVTQITPGGGFGLFQVRVWRPTAATAGVPNFISYDDAMRRGTPGDYVAETRIMRVDTALPPLEPNVDLPINAGELRLHPVPEPSVIGLGLLGVGALLMLRRRK